MATNKPYTEILEDVTLAFVKVAESDNKYQSEDREYSVNVVVSKAIAKAFKKKFPKQSVKEYDNKEFEEKFKISPPFPDEDEQWVLKLSKTHIKDGEAQPEKYRPRAYLSQDNGDLIDITTSRLIANGSKGDVAYRVSENSFGTFAHLEGIRITELIEYKRAWAANPFGGRVVTVEAENPEATQARAQREAEKKEDNPAPSLPAAPSDPSGNPDDDEDLPF